MQIVVSDADAADISYVVGFVVLIGFAQDPRRCDGLQPLGNREIAAAGYSPISIGELGYVAELVKVRSIGLVICVSAAIDLINASRGMV